MKNPNQIISIVLPEPPSANRLWRTGRNTTYLSKQAREWKESAQWLVRTAMSGREPAQGEIELRLDWYRARKSGDVDNRLKPAQDALNGIAYADDKQIKRVLLERHDTPEPETNARGVVRVTVLKVVELSDAARSERARLASMGYQLTYESEGYGERVFWAVAGFSFELLTLEAVTSVARKPYHHYMLWVKAPEGVPNNWRDDAIEGQRFFHCAGNQGSLEELVLFEAHEAVAGLLGDVYTPDKWKDPYVSDWANWFD